MADNQEDAEKQHPHASPPPQGTVGNDMSPEESRRELKDAIQGSQEVLYSATTVVPLFPDTLAVDRTKLTVTKRTFFRSAEVMSMRIEDVLNVTCTLGPFLGNVKITSRVMNDDQQSTIGPFWRSDAAKLKHITQGYVIALQREIDCNGISTKELANLLLKLGQDDHAHVSV